MKIICIGMNYAEHVRELKNEIPTEPVFFMKPDTALLLGNKPFFLPDFSNEIHYEVEIVAKICRLGKNIDVKFANRYYNEFTTGIDFTARDIQNRCRKEGKPWEIAKAFDNSAAIGKFIKINQVDNPQSINFRLDKNGEKVQIGNTASMIFTLDQVISYISRYVTLKIGDLIFTGTPPGVGTVKVGDTLEAFIENEKLLTVGVK
jgi:2-keto-4-pentenoate hydratase/2-oxohepta-3-ene-1,7-dioic acid hydratase in catechol pathway